MTTGTRLLSSAGREYELPSGTVAERLARAKADLSKLGLGGPGTEDMDIGMDVEAELRAGEEEEASKKRSSLSGPSTAPSFLPPPRFAPKAGSSLPPPKIGRKGAVAVEGRRPSSSGGDMPATPPAPPSESSGMSSPAALASPEEAGDVEMDLSKLSARERNQLKRKRKMEGKGGGETK